MTKENDIQVDVPDEIDEYFWKVYQTQYPKPIKAKEPVKE